MRKILLTLLITLALTSTASAQNVGSCGWGSKLFNGQKGVLPQSLAVTTNGTSGNQTFAITSGTSGCTQDGVVKSSWRTAAFIDSNMNRFAKDVSRGEGESLDTFASLLDVTNADKAEFNAALKNEFAKVFPSADANTNDVLAGIKNVLASSQTLSVYANRV
ncbi:MAG: DUF3015 domain-containing protein [Bdellovibrionales bacterium]|nr:DUF3015 domain-containing protein [Bdellovibrionales bacterium]